MVGEPRDPRMDADYFLPLRLEDTKNLDGEWTLIKRKELRLDIGKPSAYFVVCPGNSRTTRIGVVMIRTASEAPNRKTADLNLKNAISEAKTLMISGSSKKVCPV